MTWRELAEKINKLSEEQKDMDVLTYSVAFGDYEELVEFAFTDDDGEHPDNTPYLEITDCGGFASV